MGGLKNISFKLHKGEILGVGGLTDCGMHELGATLFGLVKPVQGEITFADQKPLTGNQSAIRHGMSIMAKKARCLYSSPRVSSTSIAR